MQTYDSSGYEEVVAGIRDIADGNPGPKTRNLTSGETAYADWLRNKTPENMSKTVEAFYPTINSEITRYSGPRNLLRSQAKILTIKAIKSFNPMSGAKLNSWIVTNLKPLSRYSVKQRDIKIPEVAARQAAQVNRAFEDLRDEYGRDPTDEEIADELGITPKRVADVRRKSVASVSSGSFDEVGEDDMASIPGVTQTNRLPFAQEAVYNSLSEDDKFIFDSITGLNGATQLPAKEVARRLGVSPAAVSQRAARIGNAIAEIVNNA